MTVLKKVGSILIPILILVSFLLLNATGIVSAKQPDLYDIIIKGGLIIDGTGTPGYKADLGIKAEMIAKIGDLSKETATYTIDASGDVVAPGFIDIHTHTDGGIKGHPQAANYVLDGVTTLMGGNCGGGAAGTDVATFLADVKASNPSVNFATLVGHGDIRQTVMDTATGEITAADLNTMKEMVKDAMFDGAFGISTGLEYIPGRYANIDELVELSKVANKYEGYYATHMRNEQTGVVSAVAEAIEIGRRSGIPVQISHLKACGAPVWGYGTQLSNMVLEAREDGIDVMADQYPYEASSTGFSQCFPGWAVVNGKTSLAAALTDPVKAAEIKAYATSQIQIRVGNDLSLIQVASYGTNTAYEGKSMADILISRGLEPTMENGIDLVIEMYLSPSSPSILYHYINEGDIRLIMANPYVMVASDGSIQTYGVGSPHPRSYGTNARVLGRYVREQNVISLEEAIRKMTSLPAKRLGLKDRGIITTGNWADITIFNPDTIIDTSTYSQPHQYPIGIDYVIVNGAITGEKGVHTGAANGQILYGPATRGKAVRVWIVTLKLSKSSVKVNTKVKYSGTVRTSTGRAGSGVVTIQKRPASGGSWIKWRTHRLNASGNYSITVKMTNRGTWSFHARMPGDAVNRTGFSAPRKLRVY